MKNSHLIELAKDQKAAWAEPVAEPVGRPSCGKFEESFPKSLLILRKRDPIIPISWVAVKELKFSYYTEETLLFTMYTHYGNLI